MKKIITIMIIMAVALMALPTMAQQNQRGSYPTYGRTYQPQRTYAPASSFHSTGSSMMNSGSMYSSSPLLNKNGSAVYSGPSYAPSRRNSSGPRRGGLINHGGEGGEGGEGGGEPGEDPDPGSGSGGGGGIGTPPDDDGTPPNGYENPIGDAVLPLLLCALAFCGVVYLRRRRALSR